MISVVRQGWDWLPPVLRQMVRFGSVSATALVVDFAAYAHLVQVMQPAALAAFVAYVIGGVWHYLLSSVVVFRHEMPNLTPMAHLARFGRYLASTLTGLAVTTLTVGLIVDAFGYHAYVGKLCAIPLSFLTVFSMVRRLVFVTATPGN